MTINGDLIKGDGMLFELTSVFASLLWKAPHIVVDLEVTLKPSGVHNK